MSLLLLLRPLGPAGPPQPPSIVSFSPDHGPIGQVVVIIGSSFSTASDVSFNGTSAISFTIDNDSQITATVPFGATTGPITITNPQGTGTSATDFTVTVPAVIVPPPPVFTGAGSYPQEWYIQIPQPPRKRKVVFSRNTETQDRDDIEAIMMTLRKNGCL
jgi:hypothetical protein